MNERDELENIGDLDTRTKDNSKTTLLDNTKSVEKMSNKTFSYDKNNKQNHKKFNKKNKHKNNSQSDNSFTEKSEVHNTLNETLDNVNEKSNSIFESFVDKTETSNDENGVTNDSINVTNINNNSLNDKIEVVNDETNYNETTTDTIKNNIDDFDDKVEVLDNNVNLENIYNNSSDNHLRIHVNYKTRLIVRIIPLVICIVLLIASIIGYNRFKNDKSSYEEQSSVNYSVCLFENKYYDDQCLGENSEYVSSLTSLIRTNFNYTLIYQLNQKAEYDYYIKSKIVVGSNDSESTIFTKERKLTEVNHLSMNGNVLNILENVDINFREFNEYVKHYSSDYSINSNAKVSISLVLLEDNQERELSSIIIPLAKTTYSISKNEIDNNKVVYSIKSNTLLKKIFLISIITFIVGLVISLLFLISFLYKMTNKKSKFDKELANILSTYDRVIININDSLKYESSFKSKKVYKVTSFFELLDLRDTIDKPIIYQKINNIKSEFYVQDSDAIYKYTIKESDFY